MRIIAGTHRGRRILAPENESTRPVTDRVKQSLFDVLTPYLAGATVFDCFAGTGSMGLECLSRESEKAIFFESGRSPLRLLRQNIDQLGFADRSQVISMDIFKWTPDADLLGKVGLIFLDPPYRYLLERPDALQRLGRMLRQCMTADGLVLFRHATGDTLSIPGLTRVDERDYGSMVVEFLAAASATP